MTIERRPRSEIATKGGNALGFALFLLLNAVLFLRPTEVIPALDGVQIFEVVILSCFAVSFPAVFSKLRWRLLVAEPITVCVLGLLVAVAFSHLVHLRLRDAFTGTFSFFKIVVYYLLFVSLVNTPRRLKWFMLWLLACLATVTVLVLLQHYAVIEVSALAEHFERVVDEQTGDTVLISRIQAAGIFGNPNDLARMLAIGIALALYLFALGRPLLLAPLATALIGLFGYTLTLTQSRGGFLALAITVFALLSSMIRVRTALLLGLLAIPLMFLLFSGRQTDLAVDEGTGQQRIQLWSEGLTALKESPLFGIGKDEYFEIGGGLGAHNSFVHSFVELGLFGGILFVAAWYLAMRDTFRIGAVDGQLPDQTLRRARPFVFAIGAGYAVGMLSSSRNYVMPTYTLLALACVQQRMAGFYAPRLAARLNGRLIVQMVAMSIAFLAATYLFVRMTAKYQ